MMNTELFSNVVGQSSAKKQLAFYLRGYHATKVFPTTLICGGKGSGKSMMAVEIAKNLYEYDNKGNLLLKGDGVTPKKKKLIEITTSTIKNLTQFVNSVLIPHQESACTFFLDEASEIPRPVTMSLLTLLNPNAENKNTLVHDEYTLEVDLSKHTFLFASSEPQSLFPPLKDRMVRLDLETPTTENLAEIVQRSVKDVSFDDGLLMDIATTLRQNARLAVKRANEIKSYLCGKKHFGIKDWASLRDSLSINNLGLSRVEISILRFLKDMPNGASLTNLSSKTNMSRAALQKDYEQFLLCQSLMQITAGTGRQITSQGLAYLKSLPC